jgi:hypothetical protein
VTIRVKYVEQKVRAYRPDELKSLFAAADPEEWLLFQFFLCTGAREQMVFRPYGGPHLDLQHVAIARHHLVEHRAHDPAQEQP